MATSVCSVSCFFFFNDTATTEIYTLSLHDALPIFAPVSWCWPSPANATDSTSPRDRKSTRLNSSHQIISYAVFCLKKKNQKTRRGPRVKAKNIAPNQDIRRLAR